MSIISLSGFTALKRRPVSYKARDAFYAVGGNGGYYIAARPRKYPRTPQQRKVKAVAIRCGIKHGISKSKLQEAMVDCVGPMMRNEQPKGRFAGGGVPS